VRAHDTADGGQTAEAWTAAEIAPRLSQLIGELASAGLVSVEVSADGGVTYALTPQGQRAARLMAMSRQAHALVLLGALVGTNEGLN